MAEITLGDLLVWEPRLRLVAPLPPAPPTPSPTPRQTTERRPAAEPVVLPPVADRDVSWAVAARASAPMLPPLRGGEVVLLAHRVLRDSGIGLGPLLRELAGHDVAAVVMEAETAPPGLRAGAPLPILVLSVGPLTGDLEGDLNRLLTQRRGELYRAGTDIGRLLAALTNTGVDATAERLAVAVEVVGADGRRLAAAGDAQATPIGDGSARAASHAVPLAGGETLWLGPLPPDRRALARLAGERVGLAVEAAFARAARLRPRGPARAAALAAFLAAKPGDGPDDAAKAAALGLAPAAPYRVALGPPSLGETGLQRLLAPLGVVHDAATVDGYAAALVDPRGEAETSAATSRPTRARPATAPQPATDAWLAISAPAPGIANLAAAVRQARYVAALLAADLIPGPVARFDRLADIGVFGLLYAHWGRPDLRAFAADVLGDLSLRDRRGVLRQTLLAYLETGGSHVDAAARLAVHRNTLAYRLKQVAGHTGYDPADPANRLLLHLALLSAALPPAPD